MATINNIGGGSSLLLHRRMLMMGESKKYQRVEYLYSRDRVDFPTIGSYNYAASRIEAETEWNEIITYQNYCGWLPNSKPNWLGFERHTTTDRVVAFHKSSSSPQAVIANGHYRFVVVANHFNIYNMQGSSVFSWTPTLSSGTTPINPHIDRCKHYGITLDGSAWLPCRRNADNALGLYNAETDTFITPTRGAETLTAGPDIN